MPNRVARLDLADCGLHATSVDLLQKVLLELEHRGCCGSCEVALVHR